MSGPILVARCLLALALIVWGAHVSSAQTDPPNAPSPKSDASLVDIHRKMKKVTQADREAAADRLKALGAAALDGSHGSAGRVHLAAPPEPVIGQGDVPDYFSPTVPNWNYSPPLRKFVDKLPGLGPGEANLLGQYLPVAVADTNAYSGVNPGDPSDYYEMAVVQYEEKMHSDLPPTPLRGYVQIDTDAIPDTATKVALSYPDGSPILDAGGNPVCGVDRPHYLGPVIIAQRDVPVRIKLYNYLPTGTKGELFVPVDPSVMGAGMGPNMLHAHMVMAMGAEITITTMMPHGLEAGDKVMLQGFEPKAYNGYFVVKGVPDPDKLVVHLQSDPGGPPTVRGHVMEMYTENRAVVHLHGGRTPWISDGTPHQWLTPAGENTAYPQGVSLEPVPDMGDSGDPRDGVTTYYYSNQQSARLMFYHDHVYGITRLNVYAGEAAGYMIQDDVESDLVADNIIPAEQKVLVIQDKTFVDASTIGELDPTWRWGTGPDLDGNGYPDYRTGDLWVPHVYMPAQHPEDLSGMAAMGRWHYGPWFWPPTTGIGHPPIPNPYYDCWIGDPSLPPPYDVDGPCTRPWEPSVIPDVPDPSMGMEAFNDTPLVNGTAYPTVTVDPKAYRFRVLNAANDRFFNLQLYEADPTFESPGVGLTEVKMVPASPYPGDPTWPSDYTDGNATWPADGREGGVPDWKTRGPDWIQIGTEGGFLPMPVVVPQRPIDWNVDVTTFDAGLVNSHSLLLGPAERADVVVDFSDFAGKTLILYNDAPAAFPAPDPRYDYYTGMPDMRDTGGRYPTDPGYGPNTRTIMQIRVNPDPVTDPWVGADLMADRWRTTESQEGVFKQAQDPIVVAQGEIKPGYTQYNEAYDATFPSRSPAWGISRIHDTTLTFRTIDGTTFRIPMEPKAIQDEMGETFDDYGRMAGKLGLQLPNPPAGGQTFVMQSYVDPSTEVMTASMTPLTPPLAGDGTQIWKITHNGVDVHPIHFHLFDVQLLNRVAWDNNIRLPDANELGWKDTVRVNPLQDTIVALRPVVPDLPFKVPDSVRLLDPTMPEGATWLSQDPRSGTPVTVTNQVTNFGWEYMWHCHILSHEEMEMMRPTIFVIAPAAPALLTASLGSLVDLAWTNNATIPLATNLVIQRATDAGFTQDATTFDVADPSATTFQDTTALPGITYYYAVRAENALGYSPWSNTASITAPGPAPTISISPPSVPLTNTGPVTYTVTYSGTDSVTLADADVTLDATLTATGTVAVSGTGNLERTVTISGITGNGTLGISIAAGTASEPGGNLAAAAGPSATFDVDNTAPTLVISPPSVALTTGGPVTYTVTYTGADSVTLADADVTLDATLTATGTVAVSGTGNLERTVTISGITGDGTLGISIAAATASDTAGNTAAAAGPSATFDVDNTAPGAVVVTDEGNWTPSLTTLRATWTPASDGTGTGIASYEYAIGTSPGTQDTRGWTPAGNVTSISDSSLSLTEGAVYFVQVRAIDNLGTVGPASASDGITVAPGVNPIGAAWAVADAVALAIRDKVVTRALPGQFWLQEPDRSAAIKVLSDAIVTQGDKVSVAGVLSVVAGQRVLSADVVEPGGSASSPNPVGLIMRSLGGEAVNASTPGVTNAAGLYNVGLLVRVGGMVTGTDTSNPVDKYFYFDDGSGVSDGGAFTGVRVRSGAIEPPASGWVLVTGVVGLEVNGARTVPVIIVPNPGDMTSL